MLAMIDRGQSLDLSDAHIDHLEPFRLKILGTI